MEAARICRHAVRLMRTGHLDFLPALPTTRSMGVLLGLALVGLWSVPSHAEAPSDPTRLYALETTGTSTEVKAGGSGTFVLRIKPEGEAYISPSTPLSLVLGGEGVTFGKTRLGLADVASGGPVEGSDSVTPHFEVPFDVTAPGSARIRAQLTFFLCTRSSCIRQVREIELPVRVR